jgi:undecaprenyl-diphosphatase
MLLQYIILGILQGIFEWLPISSEGVVALFSSFLINDTKPVDVALFLHFGTLLAVLVYFRKDWKELIQLKNPKLLKFLIIATIISLAIGYPLYHFVSDIAIGSSLLLIMGIGLLFTAYFNKKKRKFKIKFNKIAIVAGVLQGLAVIPGLSRSGSTIFGLSLGKLSPDEILKISYMMSAPVVLAGAVYVGLKNPLVAAGWPALIASFAVGLLSLHALIKISRKINFAVFALVFGILCLVGAAIRFL